MNKTYTVNARRWNDKTFGNTYHSVEVYSHDENGITALGRIPFRYGYSDHYKETSFEIAQKNGYSGDIYDWRNAEKVLFIVTDVARKKDL